MKFLVALLALAGAAIAAPAPGAAADGELYDALPNSLPLLDATN